jgi:chromosome partitioning protein
VPEEPEGGASLGPVGAAGADATRGLEDAAHSVGGIPAPAGIAAGGDGDMRPRDAPRGSVGAAMSKVWEGDGVAEGSLEEGSLEDAGHEVIPRADANEAPDLHAEEPSEMAAARVIAIANQKGGVGKSTTAVSLGAALADLGHEVLVVDLDPQGNASTGLGIRHVARDVTTYEILLASAPLEDAIVPTAVERLSAIPSTIDLAGAEIELVSQFSREMRLAKALEPVRQGHFDFILLDCPPSLGLLTINALAAAGELLVPIQCEYYALEGLGQLLRNVRLIQQNVNSKLRLTGIVMTMYDARTKLSDQVVAEVRRYFGSRVYDSVIPRTVRLSEAPGFGLPITAYDPLSRGAIMYRSLAREVAARPPQGEPVPIVPDLPEVIVPEPRPAPVENGRDPGTPAQDVQGDDAAAPEGPNPDTTDDGLEQTDQMEPDTLQEAETTAVDDLEEAEVTETDAEDPDAEPEARKRFRLFRKGGQE